MNKAEVSQADEGLNVKQLQISNGSASWRKPPVSATGKRKENKNWIILKVRKCMLTIDEILNAGNLTQACRQVMRNKGAAGVDSMGVKELKPYLDKNRDELTRLIGHGEYYPQPIRGKEIPKSNNKKRLLGIPTVVDRMLQQAVVRIIMPQYEYMFSEYSYGFRPLRNTHQAIQKSLDYINSGFQHIVDIDLKGFFDEVDHCLLLQILYRKIKCRETMRLIRRWLRVPILVDGKLVKRRKGVPQGSPLSPLLSNIMLHELDMEMELRKLRFVRYADDCAPRTVPSLGVDAMMMMGVGPPNSVCRN